jgi:hypothetical protein
MTGGYAHPLGKLALRQPDGLPRFAYAFVYRHKIALFRLFLAHINIFH